MQLLARPEESVYFRFNLIYPIHMTECIDDVQRDSQLRISTSGVYSAQAGQSHKHYYLAMLHSKSSVNLQISDEPSCELVAHWELVRG